MCATAGVVGMYVERRRAAGERASERARLCVVCLTLRTTKAVASSPDREVGAQGLDGTLASSANDSWS